MTTRVPGRGPAVPGGGGRSPRRRAGSFAVAAALIAAAAGVAGCGRTEPVNVVTPPTVSPSASAATPSGATKALARLQQWLRDPQAGTMTYNTVQVTADVSSGGTSNVLAILVGPFDPGTPGTPGSAQAALVGHTSTLVSGTTTPITTTAVEQAGTLYTSIPPAQQTGVLAGKQWASASVNTYWAQGSSVSGWLTALGQVKSLQPDGVTTLEGTTANMYSGQVDLATAPGVPTGLLGSDAVEKAGTTKVEVDVYTMAGTGKLMQVTYKIGLPVEIDASATATSTAGFEVDMSDFADTSATPTPAPSITATAPPAASVATTPGDEDLATMLPF